MNIVLELLLKEESRLELRLEEVKTKLKELGYLDESTVKPPELTENIYNNNFKFKNFEIFNFPHTITIKDLNYFDSLFQILDKFPTEEKCEEHLAIVRWNGTPICPYCESERVNSLKGKTERYKCYGCRKQFGVKVGTIFHDSKISLRKWFVAIYLITSHKKGISSYQLGRDLKISQKSAWAILQRVKTYSLKTE